MNPIVMALLLAVSIGYFLYQMRDRLLVLLHLQPAKRFDQPGRRLGALLLYGFVQKNMFRRPLAGLSHLLIFCAFLTTQVATLVYIIRGFKADFAAPVPADAMAVYNFFKDFFWILCLAGLGYFLVQRVIIQPWRFRTAEHKGKALLVIALISTLAVTEFFAQGSELARAHSPWLWELPASSLVGLGLADLSPSALNLVFLTAFWLHVSTVLFFLNLLPKGKHFHIIWALPNIYTKNLQERGHINPPNIETAEKFGMATAADLSWKQAVDTYSCTECGRCLEYCPTALTNKPLTHRALNLAIKDELALQTPNLMKLAANGKANGKEAGKGATEAPAIRELVGETDAAIHPDTIWACTTCGSCEVECPVFIEQVPRILQMRQNLVLMRGEMPAELSRTFKGMEQHSNPWGLNAENRDAWAKDLDIPRAADIAKNGELPLVYWIGCAGSFDERVKKITLAMVKILKAANMPFCILGKEEGCTGDPARRLGNEYLFQTLAAANIEILKNYKVKRILTHCPHCLQTLKNDYKGLGGGDWQVVHHTELIHELIAAGKLKPTKENVGSVAFHDSCYLVRYNGIEDAPRQVLRSIPSLKVLEFDNHGSKAVCCGAGGGRFWLEEKIGQRINHKRLEDGLAKNPDMIGSGCPFCLTMLGDGIKDKGLDDKVSAKDVAELFAASL